MTKEQAREAARVMWAWADGKEVERRFSNGWVTVDIPDWNWLHVEFRIKRTAKLRPWTADEVPLGAWARMKNMNDTWFLISSVGETSRNELFERYEHSTDGGKTWLPCGVVEEVK